MPLQFDRIKPGDVLYDRHRRKRGNTTATELVEFRVKVVEIDATRRRALVSWNGNPATWRYEREIGRYFRSSLHEKQARKEKKLDKLLTVG